MDFKDILKISWTTFAAILKTIEWVEEGKERLRFLSRSISRLLKILGQQYSSEVELAPETTAALSDLNKLLGDILVFIREEKKGVDRTLLDGFLGDEKKNQIIQYHRELSLLADTLQISTLFDIVDGQRKHDDARSQDQRALHQRLDELEWRQNRLIVKSDMEQKMTADIHEFIIEQRQEQQRQFHRLNTQATPGSEAQPDWTILSNEVEFGQKLGGRLFKGKWKKTPVALKLLKTVSQPIGVFHELMTWSSFRHPNILQFLGANMLDERPFIAVPYLQNGNARDYIKLHPTCDRLKMLHHVSLGLLYLHSKTIAHAELKAENVLIDDNEKAILCGFDKIDTSLHGTPKNDDTFCTDSRNWMAPERLMGEPLDVRSDIYSFGMMVPEIYTNETPLGELTYAEVMELVVGDDIRPKRPDDQDAPNLTDAIWELAEHCWVKEPERRPTAADVCDTTHRLLEANVNHLTTSPIPPKRPRAPSNEPQNEDGPAHSPIILREKLTMRGHTESVMCADFSPDGRRIVSGSKDKTIRVWNAGMGTTVLHPLEGHTASVLCVAFSPDGRRIASGSDDRSVRVWDGTTGRLICRSLEAIPMWTWSIWWQHDGPVLSVVFSPNSKRVASSSDDNSILIWDTTLVKDTVMWERIGPLKGHTERIQSLAFSHDGKQMVSGSWDMTMRVWDVETGTLAFEPLKAFDKPVVFVAFSADGERIISGHRGWGCCIWDANTGAMISRYSDTVWNPRQHTLRLAVRPTYRSHTHALSPNGKWAAAVYAGSKVRIQGVETHNCNRSGDYEGHGDWVSSVVFSPDSKLVVSSSHDKTVQVFTVDW